MSRTPRTSKPRLPVSTNAAHGGAREDARAKIIHAIERWASTDKGSHTQGLMATEVWEAIDAYAALSSPPPGGRNAMRDALAQIAEPHQCGCTPCMGQCNSKYDLQIIVDEMRAIAREALAAVAPAQGTAEHVFRCEKCPATVRVAHSCPYPGAAQPARPAEKQHPTNAVEGMDTLWCVACAEQTPKDFGKGFWTYCQDCAPNPATTGEDNGHG